MFDRFHRAMNLRRSMKLSEKHHRLVMRIMKEAAELLIQGERVAIPGNVFWKQEDIQLFVVGLSKITGDNVRASSGPDKGFVFFYNDDGTDSAAVSVLKVET